MGGQMGERKSAPVLINTEHKAARCSLRRRARPLGGTGSTLPSLSRAANSALQLEHGGSFFPDESLIFGSKVWQRWITGLPGSVVWRKNTVFERQNREAHQREDVALMAEKACGRDVRPDKKQLFLLASYILGHVCLIFRFPFSVSLH